MARLAKDGTLTAARPARFLRSALISLALDLFVLSSVSHAGSLTSLTVKRASLAKEKLKPNADKLSVRGALQIGPGGVDLVQEVVSLTVGPFSQTIPAHSFTRKEKARAITWSFRGSKGGLTSMSITKTGEAWTFSATGTGLSLAIGESPNPTLVRLHLGADTAEQTIFLAKKDTPKRWLFKFPQGNKDDADGDGFTKKDDCNDQDPTSAPDADERCDSVDNNCNRQVDEGFDKGAACTAGAGVCARAGVKVCAPDETTTVCNATPGTPGLELCGNSLDDDCDGETDEGFNVGTTCTVGTGACQRSGVFVCSQDRSSAVRDATPGTPTTEVCNALDDNCDSQVDEGFGTISCGQGGCEQTVAACVNGQPAVCTPKTPSAEICGNGVDEDCNGSDLPCPCTLRIDIAGPDNLSSTNQPLIAVNGTVDSRATAVTCNGRTMGINENDHTFGGNVPLREGSNIVTCVATDGAGHECSDSMTVTLDSTPPRVTIDTPQDGATAVASPITVTGLVNDLVMGTVNGDEAGVTCNGVLAQVANRRFVAENLPLDPGANTITCIGEDEVGNIDSAHISVTLDTTAQAKISIIAGNNQTAGIGELLPEPLVVRLTENGTPAVGKVVVFKVLQNDGTLTSTTSGRIVGATTDSDGRASVQFTLGSWAGAGNNQVEAMATGFVGDARFSASALPAAPNSIVVDAGNRQFGVVSQPLPKPLIATVIDRGSNRLVGIPVTFTVKDGGGNFDGLLATTVNTDSDGRAAVVLTLGPGEGFDNNLVEANFANNPGFAASFTASGKTVGEPHDTKISGVVLDNSNNPIEGVTLHVEGTELTTQSDEQGQFLLEPAPVGKVLLTADGNTVPPRDGTPWPKLEYELVTIAGHNNTIGMPIYLLPIDTPRGILVDETHGGTLTLEELPGFALTVIPGSATFPDGSRRGTVSVTLVHADKVPMVPNFGQQPHFIIIIQPAGVHFNPPVLLTMPNVDGLAPGQKIEMYSFDHDLGSFVSIGPATVNEDGTVIQSDPGVGVVKGGWHCGGNPSLTGNAGNCSECQKIQENQCVVDPAQNGTMCSDGAGVCTNGSCAKPKVEFDTNKVKRGNLNGISDKSVAVIVDGIQRVDLADFLTSDSDRDNITWFKDGGENDSSVLGYGFPPSLSEIKSFSITARHKTVAEESDQLIVVIVPKETERRFKRLDQPWCPKETEAMAACERNRQSPDCWLNKLPAVYSHLADSNGDPEPANCCPQLWEKVKSPFCDLCHLNAPFEMRSEKTAGGHGNQATYSENGQLIGNGLAAGSADMSHWSNFDPTDENSHGNCDVLPFLWAAQLDANPIAFVFVSNFFDYDFTNPLMH